MSYRFTQNTKPRGGKLVIKAVGCRNINELELSFLNTSSPCESLSRFLLKEPLFYAAVS